MFFDIDCCFLTSSGCSGGSRGASVGYGKWFYQIALFLIGGSFMKYVDR